MGVNRGALARRSEASRREVVDALVVLLATDRTDDVSFRELAGAVGVSERTLFRYFESREALAAAAVPVVHARLDHVAPPATLAGVSDYVEHLYRVCEANAGLVRSLLYLPLGRLILAGTRRERVDTLRALVAPAGGPLTAQQAAAAATMRYLASGTAWDFYRHQAGLGLEEAITTARWAVDSLLAAL